MKTDAILRMGVLALAALLAAAALPPAAGLAQEEGGAERGMLIRDLPIVEQQRLNLEGWAREREASELFRRARRAERDGRWAEAAEAYEHSAELQARGERLGAVVYELAGRAHYFSDRPARASRMWEEAGHWGLLFGDVVGAARNFLKAAVAAEETSEHRRAVEVAWKAYRLSRSELLSPAQRQAIRCHLEVVEGREG